MLFYESNLSIKDFVEETYITLRSSGTVPICRLETAYIAMKPCMHEKAGEEGIDFTALSYAWPRLPKEIIDAREVILGQSTSILSESGLLISDWKETYAVARRRRYLFDGKTRLVALLSSKSDIDDVIPTLLAFQIEWNKINNLIRKNQINIEIEEKLRSIFSSSYQNVIKKIEKGKCSITIRNCEASYSRYRQETDIWWQNMAKEFPDLTKRTIYFVSSNTHSLINLLSGFAESNAEEILAFGRTNGNDEMVQRYQNSHSKKEKSYLLYLLLKKMEEKDDAMYQRRIACEKDKGIFRHYNKKTLDITIQIIDLKKLSQKTNSECCYQLPKNLETNAVIINIDYPLGRAAYFILSKLSEHVGKLKGVYVIGKAASLFADRGDVVIPTSILDQQTRNLYHIHNCFSTKDLEGCFSSDNHGIYDRQKAVTVLGTFLQNKTMMDAFQKERIMDIEMEAGPYLSAYYEITNANRYPEEETVVLPCENIELGILHYISDNPRSKEKLDKALAWEGTDAAYATTIAILNHIVKGEQK